jgi:hypothetical protein
MAIFRVVCHREDQVFIVIDPRIWKMSSDFALAIHGQMVASGVLRAKPTFNRRDLADTCEALTFHGDDTGSNPVGDANKINNFRGNRAKTRGFERVR